MRTDHPGTYTPTTRPSYGVTSTYAIGDNEEEEEYYDDEDEQEFDEEGDPQAADDQYECECLPLRHFTPIPCFPMT